MTAPIQLATNQGNAAADTPELFFTSPAKGNGTVIEAFTAANNSESNKSYKAYIVDSMSSPITPVRPFRIVIHAEIDLGIGVVNQLIPPGGSLYIESSAINSIFFTIAGRNVSAN